MRLEAFYMYPVTNIKNGKTSSDLSADKGYIDIKEIKFSDCNLLMEWEPKILDDSINEKTKFIDFRDNKSIRSLNTDYISKSLTNGKSLDKMQVVEYNNKIFHKCYSYNYIINEIDDNEKYYLVPIKKENIQKYILKMSSLFNKKYIEKAFFHDLKNINDKNLFSLIPEYNKQNTQKDDNEKKINILRNIYLYLTDDYNFLSKKNQKKDIKIFNIYNNFLIQEIQKSFKRHDKKDSYTLSKYNESLSFLNELENEFIIIDNELWCEGKIPVCLDNKVITPQRILQNYMTHSVFNWENRNNQNFEDRYQLNVIDFNRGFQQTTERFTYYNKNIINRLQNENNLDLEKNAMKILYLVFLKKETREQRFQEENNFIENILQEKNTDAFFFNIAEMIYNIEFTNKEKLMKNIEFIGKLIPTKLVQNIVKKCEDLELHKNINFNNMIKI